MLMFSVRVFLASKPQVDEQNHSYASCKRFRMRRRSAMNGCSDTAAQPPKRTRIAETDLWKSWRSIMTRTRLSTLNQRCGFKQTRTWKMPLRGTKRSTSTASRTKKYGQCRFWILGLWIGQMER